MRIMDSLVDWSGLVPELLGKIASRLVIMEDFMAFSGVCTSWRAAATKDMFVSVSKVPLLMLSEKDDTDEQREFYSLAKGKICTRIPFPGAKGKRCIDVGFGWILTTDSSGEVCLLKPFSSARIELPNFKTFPDKYSFDPEFFFSIRGVLTANPSETSDFMMLVAVKQQLGFWRGGGEKWTVIDSRAEHMVYLDGKMYSLDMAGNVEIWDFQAADPSKPRRVPVDGTPTYFSDDLDYYLVASTNGELLLINRTSTALEDDNEYGASTFEVTRVNLVRMECEDVYDLGKDAIFLGDNVAVSVDTSEFPGVLKPNCIYFTDDRFCSKYDIKNGGKDMGIYRVQEDTIEMFND